MTSDPKEILAEFGIDVTGKDPDGQYQWKMLSLKAGSPERQRLEKAWSAFVLGRKAVDVPKPASVKTGPGALDWIKKRWMVLVPTVLGIGVLGWLLFDHLGHHVAADAATQQAPPHEWRTNYETIKTMLDSSGHDDDHHDEFVLLAEAAKSAINAGQAAKMLEQINADLAAERTGSGPQRISELAAHTAQWKIIIQALIMNKTELLDHEKFQGHHEGEL